MVERAKTTATFHLVIISGKAYVEKYKDAIQTRDVFTIWGILQLLRKYPGRLPDLEIMFETEDRPVIKSSDYRGPNATTGPPPLFRYCGDKETLDIVFPDWSFWGWQDLLKCNVSDQQDWNARLFIQDWISEGQQGFKQSNVADQCTYRYKIYIEGFAWSVSEKYILACDSVTLIVQPHYYDFFMRSMQPVEHYWPIRDDDKCRSLKFAVDWGNNHKKKAQEIGKAASSFMQEQLKMDYIYDYMFHLLNEYAKLLKFEPKIPEGAVELCSEVMACQAEGLEGRKKQFMMESLVKGPSTTSPCTLPPPYEIPTLAAFLRRKINSIMQVKKWETSYWENLNKQ
ncbi:Lipopolysaccharide-modifying protein [Corchorus olitorius]|uniref:Lipopolysaccharide-modifying protein n=1 Tax=Corchorus olitorius TaxID=93759 RepID=A0A1R3GKW3_9ROSI|nr:Lipopolysaccharide-modifying protein [Corchorus olitorius]